MIVPVHFAHGLLTGLKMVDKVKSAVGAINLTQATVNKLRVTGADYVAWCDKVPGFGVMVRAGGAKAFIVKYRTIQRKLHQIALGRVSILAVDDARKQAKAILAKVAAGEDPADAKAEERELLTVAEICERYLIAARAGQIAGHRGRPKAQSTVAIDVGRVERHIKPLIGTKIAAKLTRADVQRLHDDIMNGKTAGTFKTGPRGKAVVSGGAGTAGRVIELLGGTLTWAEKRGLVAGPNPVKGVDKIKGQPKDRVLSYEELKRLGDVLREKADTAPMACKALELIALTGCRREEIVKLKWSEIDFEGRYLRLKATKSGRSDRPLSAVAIDALRSIPHLTDHVFPARGGKGAADLKERIAELFDAAGLSDARSHDLRRTFASVAAEFGHSDALIGRLIGHRARGVTETSYIKRSEASLIAAADAVAKLISRIMAGESAQGVSLEDRRRS